MPNINIDIGESFKTFTINNDESRTITFCPTDHGLIERMGAAYDKLEAAQNKWAEEAKAAENDVHKLMAIMNDAESEMRGLIDYALGTPVSETVFRGMSVYALADGAPLWANLLLGIFDVCAAELSVQEKAENPRLQALMKKYGKKK